MPFTLIKCEARTCVGVLNRVRNELIQRLPVYFDRICRRFLPPKRSIFLICDTLLLIQSKKQQHLCCFFNMPIDIRKNKYSGVLEKGRISIRLIKHKISNDLNQISGISCKKRTTVRRGSSSGSLSSGRIVIRLLGTLLLEITFNDYRVIPSLLSHCIVLPGVMVIIHGAKDGLRKLVVTGRIMAQQIFRIRQRGQSVRFA